MSLRILLLLGGALFLVVGTAQAHFEEILRDRLRTEYLQNLTAPRLAQRLQATRAFLEHPQWSLPILRDELLNTEDPQRRWRVVQLLGAVGAAEDLPRILETVRAEDLGPHPQLWTGTIRRLYLRHYDPEATRLELSYLEPLALKLRKESGKLFLDGVLSWEVRNTGQMPLLLQPSLEVWRSQLQAPEELPIFWVRTGETQPVQLPFSLEVTPGFFYIRLDFRLHNLDTGAAYLHQTLKLPLPGIKPEP
jgi:hypothetical protein